MPKVTIWIRDEDWDRWKNIHDKPEWLHMYLSGCGPLDLKQIPMFLKQQGFTGKETVDQLLEYLESIPRRLKETKKESS